MSISFIFLLIFLFIGFLSACVNVCFYNLQSATVVTVCMHHSYLCKQIARRGKQAQAGVHIKMKERSFKFFNYIHKMETLFGQLKRKGIEIIITTTTKINSV